MTEFLQSRVGRIVTSVVLGLGSLAIGIIGAQALDGSPPTPLGLAEFDSGVAVGEAPAAGFDPVDVLVPFVEVAPDDAVVLPAQGLEQDTTPRTSGNSALVGQVRTETSPVPESALEREGEPPPGDEPEVSVDGTPGTEPPAGVYVPALKVLVFDEPEAIDPCAGPDAGDQPPVSCPPGVGSTVFASSGPPPNTGTIVDGHVLGGDTISSCPSGHPQPADGATGVTLMTPAPLVGAEILYRPIELVQPDLRVPEAPWTPLSLPDPAHDGYASLWAAAVADSDSGQTTAFCFDLPRDPDLPYEITATVTDVFNTTYVLPTTVLASQNPGARPLTTVSRVGNLATVSAWSVDGADVVFRVTPVVAGRESPTCDDPITPDAFQLGFSTVGDDFGLLTTAKDQIPQPLGVADPDFTSRHDATFGVFAGTDAIVCITILNSDNPFDILAEERLVIGSHGAWIPQIGMFAASVDVPEGLFVSLSGPCGNAIELYRGVYGGLWHCGHWDLDRPFAIDAGRDHPITFRFEDWRDGPPERDDYYAATGTVEPRVCETECEAPRNSRFARIIVSGDEFVLDTPYGQVTISEDEEIPFYTTYRWAEGTLPFGGKGWTFVGELGAPGADSIEFESESSFDTDVLTGQVAADITFFSTVPSALIGGSLTILEPGFDGVTPCGEEGPIEIGEGPTGLEHTLSLDALCPGTFYAVTAEFRVGSDVQTKQHFFTTPHLLGAYDMTVEFITDSHRSVEITDVQALIEEHQRPFEFDGAWVINRQTNRGGPARVPDRTCHPVANGAPSLISWSGEAIFDGRSIAWLEARGTSLDVSFTFRNPSVGDGLDCGQASPHAGPYTVTGSIPVASLNSVGADGVPSAGTFVIEQTVADGLAVRITLRPVGAVWASRE